MKRAICTLLLFAYLFSNTEFSQLLKMPTLVAHFFEHQQQDKAITLLEFLRIHYATDIAQNADYEQDKKLPFKTHDSCNNHFSISTAPTSFSFVAKCYHGIVASISKYPPQSEAIASAFLANIWQPPRA
ncbi:MAG: hypothetical protein IT256_01075 [Chitinophagaceae bacterium]|nr:hypothetical protein [Chitinophagaceae bacterium]